MSFTVAYDEETHFVLVTVHGNFHLSVLEPVAEKVCRCLSKNNCSHVLTDLRDAELTDPPAYTYNMPATALKTGIPRRTRRALVVEKITEDFEFLETVFQNKGNIVRLFNDMDEAKEWLLAY